ncbi:hypothetical protein KY290_028787 [Solanum tuberosum]|uniref:DCD domain-containing protein n=1 Tax=Solanum tuberosum TaxID=4113 RepID=A0ABQ7UIW4_SOLTU|nr:hypothetical protein KY290_028787 [Solanum tuberosum]
MKKRENAEVKPSSMLDQAFLPIIDSAGVSASVASPAPASSVCRAASQDKEKNEEAFMDLSEKIKPGTKLFLFDIELRLLYGVYEATSTGGINLEAHSFGGKFPAQVRSLLSLFCPLTASATAAVVSHPLAPCLANVGLPKIMPALAVEDQVKSLPYPQEVGSSMAIVGPLNTNPAFAKEHQDEPKHQPRLSTAFVDEQNTDDAVDIDSSEDTQDESDRQDDISGFIFMCGRNTKHACYRFRVFGLPSNKQERIEKIKSGAKLFLFNFEVKLLYGVYEATSTGIVNLEPLAFGGKFPAQII